jgi:hypothetical protein
MSNEKKLSFDLNTAITAVETETGKFDENAHREAVLPVRGKIMSHDGITGCFIARYGIKVDYLDNVTDAEKVAQVVQSAVDWAASNSLFPIRGQKTPTATLDQPVNPPLRYIWAIANFNSSLIAYPPSVKGGTDTEAFYTTTKPVAEKITEINGVSDFKVHLQGVAIKIDTHVTSTDDAIAHLKSAVQSFVGADGPWFPYLKGQKLTITTGTSQFA